MERTNEEYLQMIFDKYQIRHDTKIGFDYDIDKEITALDLTIAFAGLKHNEQNNIFCDVVIADVNKATRDEMIIVLFNCYLKIRSIKDE